MLGVARREAEALDPHFGPPSSLCGLELLPESAWGWPGRSTWASGRSRETDLYQRERSVRRSPRVPAAVRVSFPASRSMQLSGALAALCGVLLCAPGLFAASGESPAPLFGPHPSSARRSEVLSGALPPPLLLTNLSKASGIRSGAAPRLQRRTDDLSLCALCAGTLGQ